MVWDRRRWAGDTGREEACTLGGLHEKDGDERHELAFNRQNVRGICPIPGEYMAIRKRHLRNDISGGDQKTNHSEEAFQEGIA